MGKVLPCITFFALRYLFRCAFADDISAFVSALFTKVDHMIGG